jgi:hypothetical protein
MRGVAMGYSRPHIRQALAQAREEGRPIEGFAGDRDTVLQLERWGYLPINQDEVDRRIADWYVSQGLAIREGDAVSDTPDDTPKDTPERVKGMHSPHAAIEAAEAALVAATAALKLARSMAS